MAGHTDLESPSGDKEATQHIERVHTRDSEHGHAGHLEKDGLRIDNDDQGMCPSSWLTRPRLILLDHYTEPPMSFNRMMSLVAMAFLWTGSQIPVYLFGGVSRLTSIRSAVLTFRSLLTSMQISEAPIVGSGSS